jgi:ligand-binding sensor domain-containing protein/DNA-binding CsgD family transcriptional regulator
MAVAGAVLFMLFVHLPGIILSQTFSFDHLTIKEELSNNTVYAITRDKDGFMWFGTRDGLNKYDGYDFTVFKSDPVDSLSLTGNTIQALFNHPNGDLWIGVRAGSLCIFERTTQRFKVAPFKGKVPGREIISVQAIFQDSKGNIWLGTAGHGVFRIDREGEHIDYFGNDAPNSNRVIQNNACFSFAEDKEGNIWMGTAGSFVHCYQPQQDTVIAVGGDAQKGIDLYSYWKCLLFKDDILWIGGEGSGIALYDPVKKEFIRKKLGKALVRDLAQYGNKVLISNDGAGLFYTTDNGQTFQSLQYEPNFENSLNTNALYDIFVDQSENVWIGTFNGGINVYMPGKPDFRSYRQEPLITDAPGSHSVLCFQEDQDGHIWIGKDGGGLIRLNPSDQSYVNYGPDPNTPRSLSSNVITAIFEDSQRRLWVGTYIQGLFLLDPETGNCEHFLVDSTSLGNSNIWSIAEDRAGNLWIGTLGGGVSRFDYENRRIQQYQPDTLVPLRPGRLSDRNVWTLLVDDEDKLWIGTEFGGLNRLDPTTGLVEFWIADPLDSTQLQSNFILCLFQDHAGRLWIGTEGGGLHLMNEDERSFQHFAVEDGLPSNVIQSIEEGPDGILWLSTNNGLAFFNTQTGLVATFDQNDGLQSNQFNPSASLKSSTGEIYFGGVYGMNSFLPQKVHLDTLPPKVVFTDLKLFNRSVPVGEFNGRTILPGPLNENPTIRLRYSDNVFTIEFAALNFSSPAKCLYAYRLKDFEEEWNYVDSKKRLATYTNLDAGTYTFQVIAANYRGAWTEEPIELELIVTPPFWETWWFRTFLILFIAGAAVFLFYYIDTKRSEARNQQLNQAEQEILKLKNERLSEEVQEKNAQLSAALLQSAHKNQSLDRLKKQLLDLVQAEKADAEQKKEIRQLVRKIDFELSSEDYWEQFQLNFDQVHQQFSQLLHLRYPQLSTNEVRLCCLLRLNMTNKEIAAIQSISLSAVEKSKYRLKKKLALNKEDDLNAFIHSLS